MTSGWWLPFKRFRRAGRHGASTAKKASRASRMPTQFGSQAVECLEQRKLLTQLTFQQNALNESLNRGENRFELEVDERFSVGDVNVAVDLETGDPLITDFSEFIVQIVVISPDGTAVELLSQGLGFARPALSLDQTVFDDEAEQSVRQATGSNSTISGSVRPERQLLSRLDGSVGTGTWQLVVDVQLSSVPATLRDWSLEFQSFSAGRVFEQEDNGETDSAQLITPGSSVDGSISPIDYNGELVVGLRVDPESRVAEIDERNNSASSANTAANHFVERSTGTFDPAIVLADRDTTLEDARDRAGLAAEPSAGDSTMTDSFESGDLSFFDWVASPNVFVTDLRANSGSHSVILDPPRFDISNPASIATLEFTADTSDGEFSFAYSGNGNSPTLTIDGAAQTLPFVGNQFGEFRIPIIAGTHDFKLSYLSLSGSPFYVDDVSIPVNVQKPDLRISDFRILTGTAQTADEINIEYAITNDGPGDAVALDVDVVLSTNPLVSSADLPIAGFQVQALAAGETATGTATFTLSDETLDAARVEDVDWYEFSIPESLESGIFEAEIGSANSEFRPALSLFADNGVLIESVGSGVSSAQSTISRSLSSGTYRLSVLGVGRSFGSYSLDTRIVEREFDNSIETATPLLFGATGSGAIATARGSIDTVQFGSLDTALLGLRVDGSGEVAESHETNNHNQGLDVDLVQLDATTASQTESGTASDDQLADSRLFESFETGDLSALNWSRFGDNLWQVQSSPTRTGANAVQVAVPQDGEASLRLEIETEDGEIEFSQLLGGSTLDDGEHSLTFSIDGQVMGVWTAATEGFATESFSVIAGIHVLEWVAQREVVEPDIPGLPPGFPGLPPGFPGIPFGAPPVADSDFRVVLDDIVLPVAHSESPDRSQIEDNLALAAESPSVDGVGALLDGFESGDFPSFETEEPDSPFPLPTFPPFPFFSFDTAPALDETPVLTASGIAWQQGGDAGWRLADDVSSEGALSIQAGSIGDNQSSSVEFTFDTAAGEFEFSRRVSSESGFDFLIFEIDDVEMDRWSGDEFSFSRESYTVSQGNHTFRWTFEKDSSVSGGLDSAWIDDISIPIPSTDSIDLIVTSISINDEAPTWGDTFLVTYNVQNQGTSDAGGFDVELRLSDNETISSSDVLLDTVRVGGLPAGASATQSATLTLPGSPAEPPLGRVDTDFYLVEIDESLRQGQLIIDVVPEVGFNPTVTLLDDSGTLLVFSDDRAIDDSASHIEYYLQQGTYFLKVAGADGSAGEYQLNARFERSTLPEFPLITGDQLTMREIVKADFNGDGLDDIAARLEEDNQNHLFVPVRAVEVHIARQDGTFERPIVRRVGGEFGGRNSFDVQKSLSAGDLNGDGLADLIALNNAGNTTGGASISILFGQPGGGVSSEQRLSLSIPDTQSIEHVETIDANGDGFLDLLVTSHSDNFTIVLPGRGDGTFESKVTSPLGAERIIQTRSSDVSGDGITDLVALVDAGDFSEIVILAGSPEGSFAEFHRIGLSTEFNQLLMTDINLDGQVDVVATDTVSLGEEAFELRVAVVSNHGVTDWTISELSFSSEGEIDVTSIFAGNVLVAADVDQDGLQELFVDGLSAILQVDSGGSFSGVIPFDVGTITAAEDVNQDGRIDLIASASRDSVQVLLSRGELEFESVGGFSFSGQNEGDLTQLIVNDFTGDGIVDLVAPAGLGVVMLSGRGDGTFSGVEATGVGADPFEVLATDFNNDGILDLATVGNDSGDVTIQLGLGTGAFLSPQAFQVGESPVQIVSGDFNLDGFVDLATVNAGSNDVSVLPGQGNGTFASAVSIPIGAGANSLVGADFNNDGRVDLAAGSATSGTVTVMLATARADVFELFELDGVGGLAVRGLVTGDFNGDSFADIASANVDTSDVAIFAGDGNGSFETATRLPQVDIPIGLIVSDFDVDGIDDLAVALPVAIAQLDFFTLEETLTGGAAIIPGVETGLFQTIDAAFLHSPQVAFSSYSDVGALSLTAADFNNDGLPDLFAHRNFDLNGTVAFGTGDLSVSNSTSPPPFGFPPIGFPPQSGSSSFNNAQSVELPTYDFEFFPDASHAVPSTDDPFQLFGAGDFDGDGFTDLVAVVPGFGNLSFGEIRLYRGDGSGELNLSRRIPATGEPGYVLVEDLNNDGRDDVVVTNRETAELTILLGEASDELLTNEIPIGVTVTPRPQYGDVTGDGVSDLLVLVSDQLLLRRGIEGELNQFLPQERVSRSEQSVKDVTIVDGQIVTLDSEDKLTIYSADADGELTASATGLQLIPNGRLTQLAARDLDGDSVPELVITDSSGQLLILPGSRHGTQSTDTDFIGPIFTEVSTDSRTRFDEPAIIIGLGQNISGVAFSDMDNDGQTEVVVTTAGDGLVRVLKNRGELAFNEVPYLAGSTPYSLSTATTGSFAFDRDFANRSQSLVQPVDVLIGDFVSETSGSESDVAVLLTGQLGVQILAGTDSGTLANATVENFQRTSFDADVFVSGQFNRGVDSFLDIAVLDSANSRLQIFFGNGNGSFSESRVVEVGHSAVGITSNDLDNDTADDLLISTSSGDVTLLLSNGDGTFRQSRTQQDVPLAVSDLDGDGVDDVVLGSELLDRVTIQYGVGNSSTDSSPDSNILVDDASAGVASPNDVYTEDLDGDGTQDLIVVNSGGNEILVYTGEGSGQFGDKQSFAVGSDPASATFHDLNDDGMLDLLVANRGSNDVSVLLGSRASMVEGGLAGVDWTLTEGPRFESGSGPTAVQVADVVGDSSLDLVVTNSLDATLTALPGLGGTFFDTNAVSTVPIGNTGGFGGTLADFNGDGAQDFVALDPFTNAVSFVNNLSLAFSGSLDITRFSSGGVRPVFADVSDFNSDGFADLLVANSGDGSVVQLLGGALGFSTGETFLTPDSFNPTALALAEQDGGGFNAYVTSEGDENVFVFQLAVEGNGDQVVNGTEDDDNSLPANLVALLRGESAVTDSDGGEDSEKSPGFSGLASVGIVSFNGLPTDITPVSVFDTASSTNAVVDGVNETLRRYGFRRIVERMGQSLPPLPSSVEDEIRQHSDSLTDGELDRIRQVLMTELDADTVDAIIGQLKRLRGEAGENSSIDDASVEPAGDVNSDDEGGTNEEPAVQGSDERTDSTKPRARSKESTDTAADSDQTNATAFAEHARISTDVAESGIDAVFSTETSVVFTELDEQRLHSHVDRPYRQSSTGESQIGLAMNLAITATVLGNRPRGMAQKVRRYLTKTVESDATKSGNGNWRS